MAGAGGPLLVNGPVVPCRTPRPVMPFIEDGRADQVTVTMHDWASRLDFTGPGGLDEKVFVAPTKLAEDTDMAFAALRAIADQLPGEVRQLGYPLELVPAVPDVAGPGVNLDDLEGVAADAGLAAAAALDGGPPAPRRPGWRSPRPGRLESHLRRVE